LVYTTVYALQTLYCKVHQIQIQSLLY